MDTTAQELFTLKELLTGSVPITYWIALFVFYMVGATIYQGLMITDAIGKNQDTPNKFSIVYYFSQWNNHAKFLVATLSAVMWLRFASALVSVENNIESMMFFALVLGACWQILATKLINKLNDFLKKVI